MARRPVVGIVCDRRLYDGHDSHLVHESYIAAIRDGAGALPVLLPVLDPPLSPADIFASVDGLLFPGSPSNVNPALYGQAPAQEPVFEDRLRDSLVMPLLRAVVEEGVPSLCICRGLQELNVALGDTLYQEVHKVPGRFDHREDESLDLDGQYGPAHEITLVEEGLLARSAGAGSFRVNSLHGQGIDHLAPPLRAEAYATDGQIEAVSLLNAKAYLLGVQWHPEWRWHEHALSRAIFSGFALAFQALLRR